MRQGYGAFLGAGLRYLRKRLIEGLGKLGERTSWRSTDNTGGWLSPGEENQDETLFPMRAVF